MLKRFDIYKIISSRKKDILKKVNGKIFKNLLKSKILKYSLSIKNENMIRHRRTFKNSYSSLKELIFLIKFNVLVDLAKHSICCIIFFRILKKEMHFASTDKDENIKLHEITMTLSIIYDFFFVIVRALKMSREIAVRMK